MRITGLLMGRNLSLFFRDRMGVFLSLLSAVILFALHALFLGNLQVQHIQEQFPNASTQEVEGFVNSWVFAGIVMITTLTTGLSALSIFVDDRASGRFKDFMVSPVRRGHLVGGYLLSSFTIAVLMSTIILIAGQICMAAAGNAITPWPGLAQTFGYICLLSAAFSALSAFIVTFINHPALPYGGSPAPPSYPPCSLIPPDAGHDPDGSGTAERVGRRPTSTDRALGLNQH